MVFPYRLFDSLFWCAKHVESVVCLSSTSKRTRTDILGNNADKLPGKGKKNYYRNQNSIFHKSFVKTQFFVARCWKITEKVTFEDSSKASSVYILSSQKIIKNSNATF